MCNHLFLPNNKSLIDIDGDYGRFWIPHMYYIFWTLWHRGQSWKRSKWDVWKFCLYYKRIKLINEMLSVCFHLFERICEKVGYEFLYFTICIECSTRNSITCISWVSINFNDARKIGVLVQRGFKLKLVSDYLQPIIFSSECRCRCSLTSR